MHHDKNLVITFVAGDGAKITPDFLQSAAVHLNSTNSVWLNGGVAADIFCAPDAAKKIRASIQKFIGTQPIDVIVQHAATRKKKILLADMESTIIVQEMLDELADMIGMRAQVAEVTRRAMNGELDFAAALRARVALFKGRHESILTTAAEKITLMPGAKELVATMKKNGATCWLVSGGFTCFVEPVARQLGFDKSFANILVVRDGMLTGEVADPILDKTAKKTLLQKACAEQGVELSCAATIGDGANDIPMLSTCSDGGGLGIAYQAKPNVRAAVADQINYGDLKTLLYAQGYKSSEFSK